MADLNSSAYNAGLAKGSLGHTNWAEDLAGLVRVTSSVLSDTDKLLNTIRAQEDEKISTYISSILEDSPASNGVEGNGKISQTVKANENTPENMTNAFNEMWNASVNVEAIMSGANVSKRAAERWMREWAPDMKANLMIRAEKYQTQAMEDKAFSDSRGFQNITYTNPDLSWDQKQERANASYVGTGMNQIDLAGNLNPAEPRNQIPNLYTHSVTFGAKQIDDSIAMGLSREDAINSSLAEFDAHVPATNDGTLLANIKDIRDKLKTEIGSYYDAKYDESNTASSRKFDGILLDAYAYMDSHNGSITRDALYEIAINREYNPASSFDQANMMSTLRDFGLLGGASESVMGEPIGDEVPKTPEERFLKAEKDYIAANGDIGLDVLEQLAEENGVSLNSDSYQTGLSYAESVKTYNENERVVEAMEALYSYTVDWDKDSGIGNYSYKYTEGNIDEDISALSASNQAAIANFNALNSAEKGEPQLAVYYTGMKPLMDRMIEEYNITSPEARASFAESFVAWEGTINHQTIPESIREDIEEKYYDLSLSDEDFNSFLIGRVKSGDVDAYYYSQIMNRGERQTLIKNIKPFKDAITNYIDSLGLGEKDTAALSYQVLNRYGADSDLSRAYLISAGMKPNEIEQYCKDAVDSTWRIMNNSSFSSGIYVETRRAFKSLMGDNNWEIDDYNISGKSSKELYGDYMEGLLPFILDGEDVGNIETALLNGEMTDYDSLLDNSARIVYGRPYEELDNTSKNIVEASASIATTEATMIRIYDNYFGSQSPQGNDNWRTCRIDGRGIGYMNKSGFLVSMSFENASSQKPVFDVYKFNNSDEEYQAVFGRNPNNNTVLSLYEYQPVIYDASDLKERTKNTRENSVYDDPSFQSAMRSASSLRIGR